MTNKSLPAQLIDGQQRSYTVDALWEGTKANGVVSGDRQLLNLVLPMWQRPAVWTTAQQVQFVEGMFLGLGTGYYVINGRDFDLDGNDLPMSGWLIDGQQRITAIAAFIKNEFCVFDGIQYSDLSPRDKRIRFDSLVFPCIELDYEADEDVLKELYRRLNYSGTAHTEEDLARLG